MRNEYPGICYRCGKTVEPGEGHFERYGVEAGRAKWRVQHADCAIRYRGTKHTAWSPVDPAETE